MNYKYPIFYYLQFIVYPIFTILWLFGFILGIYFIQAEKTFFTVFWITIWLLAGWFTFYWGTWYKCGKQTIEVKSEGIKVSKKFMLYHRSKLVSKKNILTISYKELKPYNFFTGKDIEIKERLGWLVINGDSDHARNSYLYPIDDLEKLIEYYKIST